MLVMDEEDHLVVSKFFLLEHHYLFQHKVESLPYLIPQSASIIICYKYYYVSRDSYQNPHVLIALQSNSYKLLALILN